MDRPGSGMRWLTGLLLALNLGVLVVGLGFMYWPAKPATMPEFNGDKVKILSTPAGADSANLQATLPVEPPPALPDQPVQPETGLPETLCLSWNRLDADKLLTVEAHLKQLGISPGSYELRLPQRLGWWVYLPPFRDPETMRTAMDDARQKGVTDMAQVRGGKLANAVSLGAFPTLEKAREQAATLAAKGLTGVKLGPRPEAGEVRLLLSGKAVGQTAERLAKDWPKDLQPGACAAD